MYRGLRRTSNSYKGYRTSVKLYTYLLCFELKKTQKASTCFCTKIAPLCIVKNENKVYKF